MMKQGNDSVIVLTDNVEEFTASWPSSLPCPARLVDVPTCLANTPLQHWLESPELASAVFRQQNIANAVRLAAIYKHGGTYIDLDIIPLQDKLFSAEGALSMQCTVEECGEEFWLNNAYLNFPPKHPFMWQLMNAFALEFNGKSSLPMPSAPQHASVCILHVNLNVFNPQHDMLARHPLACTACCRVVISFQWHEVIRSTSRLMLMPVIVIEHFNVMQVTAGTY